jgi:hypothetical protein
MMGLLIVSLLGVGQTNDNNNKIIMIIIKISKRNKYN